MIKIYIYIYCTHKNLGDKMKLVLKGHNRRGLLTVWNCSLKIGHMAIHGNPVWYRKMTAGFSLAGQGTVFLLAVFRIRNVTGKLNTTSAHCTLHTTHFTLHTTHFTLHTANCTLHTARLTLKTWLYTAHCSSNQLLACQLPWETDILISVLSLISQKIHKFRELLNIYLIFFIFLSLVIRLSLVP